MLVTYPYASMASTWDNREPSGAKGILFMGQKGSLWDRGILFMGQRDPYGTKEILIMGQGDPYGTKGSLSDKGILMGPDPTPGNRFKI